MLKVPKQQTVSFLNKYVDYSKFRKIFLAQKYS